eukprot:749439-Hanusia_phi.AAC.1
MPAINAKRKKAELTAEVKKKIEQEAFTSVLEKDITCNAAPMCYPVLKTDQKGARPVNGKEKTKSTSKKQEQSDTNASNQPTFWSRFTRKEYANESSLETGRGNKFVPRSIRDAREDAVCKIETQGKSGSGFFVHYQGHLAILTNNHVLPTRKLASIAVATVHKGSIEISLYPQRLWQTSPKEALDYTFVACESPSGVESSCCAVGDNFSQLHDGLRCSRAEIHSIIFTLR